MQKDMALLKKRERKDDMPKKHDPQRGREKRWHAKEARPKKRAHEGSQVKK